MIVFVGYLHISKNNLKKELENSKIIYQDLQYVSDQKSIQLLKITDELEKIKNIKLKKDNIDKAIEENRKNLEKTFDKHDMDMLFYNKPAMLEKIINDATHAKKKCIESITVGGDVNCNRVSK
jgi:hypothetical protein